MTDFTEHEREILLLALWQWKQTDPTLNEVNRTWEDDQSAAGLQSILESVVTKLGGRPETPGFGIGWP
jgi:hypothetical protein